MRDPGHPNPEPPPSADAAAALFHAGRHEEAHAALQARIAAGAADGLTLQLMGLLAAARLDHVAAEGWLARAVAARPSDAQVLRQHGQVLRRLGRAGDALARYQAALALAPQEAQTHLSLANLLNDLRRWREAQAAAEAALRIDATLAPAANALGNAHVGQGRAGLARASYERAAALSGAYADPLVNLGNTELALGSAAAALAAYDRALALAPDLAAVWSGRGQALSALRRWPEAVAAYDRAWTLDPHLPFLAGQRLHARMKICDWSSFDSDLQAVRSELAARRAPSTPFPLLAAPFTGAELRAVATLYAESLTPERATPPARPRARHGRIRLAYVSADYHEHATAWLIAELIERHDRQRFEVIGLSLGPPRADPMRLRLEAAFDRFYDLSRLDDASATEVARSLALDIAVDLKGYTTSARPALFAARIAPVQVSYLGYPGTLGGACMDYIVADPVIIPPALRGDYSEKVASVTGCYQPNDRTRPHPPLASRREDHGLPATGFVFGCFNNNYKITPAVFESWMRLLWAVDGAVLWLFQDNPIAAANLRAAARSADIDPSRLVFADLRPLEDHLERHRHMDLFLDTSPYNAHTTASDALWMGTPLVTWPGTTFAGRVAASLVAAAGVPELVAGSAAEAETLALDLARDPARLAAIRARLDASRGESVLFDTPRLAGELEQLYCAMQAQAGLPPDHLNAADL